MSASLYERLGGEPAVSTAVEIFYRKVLADERIKHFFDDADMDAQLAKQKTFMTMAFGGPNNYSGKDLRTGHEHLVHRGLDDSHVDAVLEQLAATLTELDVPQAEIREVCDLADGARGEVLGR